MDTTIYLQEVEKRLRKMLLASKDGYKATPAEKHRLEGFMQAGVFLKLASNTELSEIMDAVHKKVFGQTIAQRQADSRNDWHNIVIDYGQYEQPTYQRRRESKNPEPN